MENLDPPGIIFRVSIMYVYALALVRISGKESIGRLTAMDFVVTTIIGDLFDDVFWSEVPIVQGIIGFATIILMHLFVTFASSRNKPFYRLVTSPERLIIKDGKLVLENLQREWMRPETVQSDLRINGEEHPREVKEAWLEPNGEVSVLMRSSSKPVQKKDKRLLR